MTLRGAAIETAASRIWNQLPRYELMYPECERTATVVLDAVLDVLSQNTEEWADLYPITKTGFRGRVGRNIVADVLPKAIAVLREHAHE